MNGKSANDKSPVNKKHNPKLGLHVVFMLGVALVIVLAEVIVSVIEFLLARTEWLTQEKLQSSIWVIFMWGGASMIIGLVLAAFVGRWVLRPVSGLIDGLTRLSEGDYSTRIEERDSGTLRSVSKSFNHLAEELEKTEIMRSDFVNSFSHEFKTPISSINGLIALMKTGKLSQKKQREYLDIIAEETSRLSDMTTNILNLTKYESQGILTDKTTFNLSEQIRTSVLLLERKWSQKKLNLSLDFDEYELEGNDDMLRQVWVNLLDNAIKFSNEGGSLAVRIRKEEGMLLVDVENSGSEIKEDDRQRVFQKFYRADAAHEKEGNGIGLSIVGSIVRLHGGRVTVACGEGKTVFTVALPCA